LDEANLEGANLVGALYNDFTVWPDGFEHGVEGSASHKIIIDLKPRRVIHLEAT
jgi:hypothetical protein